MSWRAGLSFAALLLVALAVTAFRPASTPGPFLRDFEAYWSAGAAWNAHADPYGRAVWDAERGLPGVNPARDELLPFVGPPATVLAWSAFARLPYGVAARVWLAVLVFATVALTAFAVRAAKASARSALPAALLLAFAFGPLTSDLALGQIALLAFAAAAFVAFSAPADAFGFAARAAGTFVALFQPNVGAGLVSQLGRVRVAAAIFAGAAGAYAAGAAIAGWGWPLEYARILTAHANVERFSAIQLTPAAIAHGAGASPASAAAAGLLCAAGAIVAAAVLWRRVRDPFARFASFSCLAPLVATFFHEHDLVVAYAAAAWCGVRTRGAVRALALFATLLAGVDWLGLAQRPNGVAQSALLAGALAFAFAGLGNRSPSHRSLAAVTACAALFFFGAWLGVGHPAPVWPDALGAFHAPPNAAASAVWLAEQRLSGLLAVNPVWAFLRALSLAGSALLALAIYLHYPRHPEQDVSS